MDKAEVERMKGLLVDAITTLCRSGMRFTNSMKIEGLLGITLDEKDIVLINLNKSIGSFLNELSKNATVVNNNSSPAASKRPLRRRSVSESSSDEEEPRPKRRPEEMGMLRKQGEGHPEAGEIPVVKEEPESPPPPGHPSPTTDFSRVQASSLQPSNCWPGKELSGHNHHQSPIKGGVSLLPAKGLPQLTKGLPQPPLSVQHVHKAAHSGYVSKVGTPVRSDPPSHTVSRPPQQQAQVVRNADGEEVKIKIEIESDQEDLGSDYEGSSDYLSHEEDESLSLPGMSPPDGMPVPVTVFPAMKPMAGTPATAIAPSPRLMQPPRGNLPAVSRRDTARHPKTAEDQESSGSQISVEQVVPQHGSVQGKYAAENAYKSILMTPTESRSNSAGQSSEREEGGDIFDMPAHLEDVVTKAGMSESLEIDEGQILAEHFQDATTKSTLCSVKTFRAYLREKGLNENFKNYEKKTLNNILKKFWPNARQRNGEPFKKTSLTHIRFGLSRYLQVMREYDLLIDPVFRPSNLAFKQALRELNMIGKGKVDHIPDIIKDDLYKLYSSFDMNMPDGLQEKVLFDVLFFLSRYGYLDRRDHLFHLREHTKDTFQVAIDEKGEKFVYRALKKDGPVDYSEKGPPKEERMYAQPGSTFCPVASFERYISLLSNTSDNLWRRAARKPDPDEPWYLKEPLGKNTLGTFMRTCSRKYGLSQEYSNGSVRRTPLSALDEFFETTSGYVKVKFVTVPPGMQIMNL